MEKETRRFPGAVTIVGYGAGVGLEYGTDLVREDRTNMNCYRKDCERKATSVVEWKGKGYRPSTDNMCDGHARISAQWSKAILPVGYGFGS